MSLFPNQNPNRRIKKGGSRRTQNLLEVSARPTGERRESIFPQIFGVFKVLSAVMLLGGVCFGGKTVMRRLVWENPMYALTDIRVSTDGLLTRKQVLEIAEIEEGRNIFSVDLKKARQNLDQLPQIDRVEVRRLVPDRLDIKIIERQPVAWVAPVADSPLVVGGDAMLVDSRGYVMRSRKIQPEHTALPVIVGISMEDVAAGQKLPSAEGLAAIDLIRLSADDLRWQPRIVDVSKGYCLLVTDHRKAKVTFGFDGLEDQLARLKHLIELVEPSHREFQSVNLMLEKSVPVVFAAPSSNAPLDPKKNGGKPTQSKAGGASPAVGSMPQNFQPPSVVPVAPTVAAVSQGSGVVAGASASLSPVVSADGTPSGGVVSRSSTVSARRPAEPVVDTPPPAIKNSREQNDSRAASLHATMKATPAGNVTPNASNTSIGSSSAKSSLKAEKGTSNSDKHERAVATASSERAKGDVAKGDVVEKKPSNPKQVPAGGGQSGSLSPSEALRKLFNPHG